MYAIEIIKIIHCWLIEVYYTYRTIQITVKCRNTRIRTPLCRALKKLNNIDGLYSILLVFIEFFVYIYIYIYIYSFLSYWYQSRLLNSSPLIFPLTNSFTTLRSYSGGFSL